LFQKVVVEGKHATTQLNSFFPRAPLDAGGKAIENGLSIPLGCHQACISKDAKMVGEETLIHGDFFVDAPDVLRPLEKGTYNGKSSGIGQSFELGGTIFGDGFFLDHDIFAPATIHTKVGSYKREFEPKTPKILLGTL
jgi:hypothetical protein